MVVKRLSLLLPTIWTALAAADSHTCPPFSFSVDGGSCDTIQDFNAAIDQVFFPDASAEENGGVEIIDEQEDYMTASVPSLDVSYSVQRGETGRRGLGEEAGALLFPTDRNLLACGGTSSSCTAWWCCTFCGWNCRRRNLLLDDNEKEDTDDRCAFINNLGPNAFDGTCLEGATMTCAPKDGKEEEEEEDLEAKNASAGSPVMIIEASVAAFSLLSGIILAM